jgi:hypothetical protein
MFRLVLTLALAAGLAGMLRAQTVVFHDPFTFAPASPGGTSSDPNLDLPARQSGGAVSSAYTKASIGHSGNNLFLQDDLPLFGPSDALLLRTQRAAGASQVLADLDANFGSRLAGRTWEIDFDSYHARNNAAITDSWFAVSVGDDSTGIEGPNHPSADFAILVRGDGRFTAWTDNVPFSGTASPTELWGKLFHLKLVVEELKAVPDVTALLTVDGITSALGSWPVTWDNTTQRRVELRAHQGGGAGTGLMDARIDNLTFTVTRDLDHPPVLFAPVAAQR